MYFNSWREGRYAHLEVLNPLMVLFLNVSLKNSDVRYLCENTPLCCTPVFLNYLSYSVFN